MKNCFKNWLQDRVDVKTHYNIFEEGSVIKIDKCFKCGDKIRDRNAIMFVKHLIDKHRHDIQNFILNEILKE